MARLDTDQATAIAAITQLINRWARDLDRNNGLGMAPLLADDCAYSTRGVVRHGPGAVIDFYKERLAEFARAGREPPTHRHILSNLLVDFTGPDRAGLDFMLVYFSSPDPVPVMTLDGPVAVAEVRMECSRDVEGEWRIALFDSMQSFVKGG